MFWLRPLRLDRLEWLTHIVPTSITVATTPSQSFASWPLHLVSPPLDHIVNPFGCSRGVRTTRSVTPPWTFSSVLFYSPLRRDPQPPLSTTNLTTPPTSTGVTRCPWHSGCHDPQDISPSINLLDSSEGTRHSGPVWLDLKNLFVERHRGNPQTVRVTLFFPLSKRGLFQWGY